LREAYLFGDGTLWGIGLSYRPILERLKRLYEFRDIVVRGRERGFPERGEALRLVRLLRDLVADISGGEARLTLYLLTSLKSWPVILGLC